MFSYSIPSVTKIDQNIKTYVKSFDALRIESDSKWNLALDIENEKVGSDIQVEFKSMPDNPWIAATTPISLKVPAWEISGWGMENGYTPDLPNEYKLVKKDTITLVPLGCTTLRLTIFPDVRKRFTINQLSKNQ
jgi:hypothetical protein